MAFRASKTRSRKEREPIAEGLQLVPSAAIREWYSKQLRALVAKMIADYRKEIAQALRHDDVKRFYAADASPASIFKKLFNKLDNKWSKVFAFATKDVSRAFVDKVDGHSKATAYASLSAAGIEQPRTAYNENVRQTMQASVEFNNTLITGIQAEAHERIYNAVMGSITSPNPAEQGMPAILSAINKIEGMTEKRADLIARDQSSKLYGTLNIERMKQNGVTKFKWVHSSAGKVPRQTHLDKDGEIFEHDDERLWTGPKGDQGPPGWAINCRCRAVPVIDLD